VPMIGIDGIDIAYDIIGDGQRPAVITPGGRFSKDTPGVRALAEKLAEGGLRVLIWDRPNCGESAVSFAGPSESRMNADVQAGLLRALRLSRALLVGGSRARGRSCAGRCSHRRFSSSPVSSRRPRPQPNRRTAASFTNRRRIALSASRPAAGRSVA